MGASPRGIGLDVCPSSVLRIVHSGAECRRQVRGTRPVPGQSPPDREACRIDADGQTDILGRRRRAQPPDCDRTLNAMKQTGCTTTTTLLRSDVISDQSWWKGPSTSESNKLTTYHGVVSSSDTAVSVVVILDHFFSYDI